MNAAFHKLAPALVLKQMPETFRSFMLTDGYTEEQLGKDADLPDTTDKDNLTQNSEIHHAHSYKLEMKDGQLKWIDGDALERLKGLAADAHDFNAEGKLEMVRYCLAKMTHYIIDGSGPTYPHLHRGKPWSEYHEKFEKQMGFFISAHAQEIGPLTFHVSSDLYKRARATAFIGWSEGLEVVKDYQANGGISQEKALHICRFALQNIGDIWTTIATEMKII